MLSATGFPVAVSRSAFDEWLGRVEDRYISCCGLSGSPRLMSSLQAFISFIPIADNIGPAHFDA